MKRKNNIFVLIFLFVTLVISGGYYFYNKYYSKEDLPNIMEEPEEEYKDPRLSEPNHEIEYQTNLSDNEEHLKDDDYYSTISLDEGESIIFTTEENIYNVYIETQSDSTYKINYNDDKESYLATPYIHQYITLKEETNEIIITFYEPTELMEVKLYTIGTPDKTVQVWQEPYEDADMLALPTHGDDEHLWFGGTLPYYAGELDKKVQLVYLTSHTTEPKRYHEILNGLWTVGVEAYPIFGPFQDIYSSTLTQAKSQYDYEEMIKFQVEMIRRFHPEVIIAHDIEGEYGHGGHKINTASLIDALELSNDETKYSDITYEPWEVPKTYIHLYEENQIDMDWNITLDYFDGKTALEMAEIGYSKHESQQYAWFYVSDEGKYDCSLFGLYKSTVGPDIEKNGFFENIN